MNKLFCTLFLFVFIVAGTSGCNFGPDNTNEIRISTPNAPQSIPLFYMQENNVLGDYDLAVEIHNSSQQAVIKIMKEDLDIALLGVQEAAKLYNNDFPIRLINISNWATFEMLTTRNDINRWDDLVGKTVWLGDKGGPIDLLTQIVMEGNGLSIKDLDIQRISANELAQMVITETKNIELFVLREPFASQVRADNPAVETVFHLGDEYQALYNEKMPQGGIMARVDFAQTNPDLLDSFQAEYQKAIQWMLDCPDEASQLGAKYLPGLDAQTIAAAIENMDMEIVRIENAQAILELYYEQVLDLDADILGGKLPAADFYNEIR